MELEEAVTRLTRDITKPLACGDICVVSISDVETVLQELKRYKRLAKANLKDSEEFKNNMCEHRCVLNSELQELQENSIPKKKVKKLKSEYEKKYKKHKTVTDEHFKEIGTRDCFDKELAIRDLGAIRVCEKLLEGK